MLGRSTGWPASIDQARRTNWACDQASGDADSVDSPRGCAASPEGGNWSQTCSAIKWPGPAAPAIADWLAGHGVPRAQASRYVASIFADVGGEASSYATPGGINERFAALLDEAGVFDAVRGSLDAILDGLA